MEKILCSNYIWLPGIVHFVMFRHGREPQVDGLASIASVRAGADCYCE